MDDFIKSVETPKEAIEVFNQLQLLLSQHGFELKKWISNNDAVTKAIPEDLKSISNTKQVEVVPSTEGSSVLGLQWTVTDDSLQVCRGTNKEVETPITQRKILSLGSYETNEWYLPHHPVLSPNKPGKVRRVCNAASKYKEVCLKDEPLAGPDLLHGLIGTIFRFPEGLIALTADIESMFLQVQVPEQDRSCLRFLWRPRTNEPVQIYEYQRHVFGAKSSPTCANYALKRVGLENEKEYPIPAKAIQTNFYMDDFIKSVETPEEAIEVSNQLQLLLSQHGFELKKWISNNDAVTRAIPEDLKSISKTKQVEVEPSTEGSSVLGLQWTVTDDSLQVCRGTNKEVETPITQRKILSLGSYETTSERHLD